MLPTIILSVLLWVLIGYLVFYFRYGNKHFVDELRNNLNNTRNDLEKARADAAEFEQQNIIFRNKVTDLLAKNDDLSKIVWELSRAYYRIKLAAEKVDELHSLLKIDDKQLEEKMQSTIWDKMFEKITQEKKNDSSGKKR
jgi:cbb3-type cytochrome oxidase subunit 3